MSREVRRMPVEWQHPTEPNPYWREHAASALRRGTMSRLHLPQERFVGLMSDYPEALTNWQAEVESITSRTGHRWEFSVEYHLTGYKGHDDAEPTVHPLYTWADDGETEIPIQVRDEDHLQELEASKVADEKPDRTHYMPEFEGDPDALGWCLYETVSEGTPITPVFATAEELIEHLVEHGEDWRQEPYRRAAAEALVNRGGSMGSMVVTGGTCYDGARDLDVLTKATS